MVSHLQFPNFVVYDPLALDPEPQQPSWYLRIRNLLQRRYSLPWTHDADEAGKAQCVLALTSELNAETCARLSPAGCIIILFTGIYAQKFCAVVPEIQSLLDEEGAVCEWADFSLVPSRYASELLQSAYGAHLAPKLRIAGLPVDLDHFAGAPEEPRDMKQIVLGQRQDYDKNFLLEADLCTYLLAHGYRLVRASSRHNPRLNDFSVYAERHLGVPGSNTQPQRYVSTCRQSGFVLLTSQAETLCMTAIEAVAAGCIPVVPDHSAFREWCHADNRYNPYSFADILRILRQAPIRQHDIAPYHPDRFIECVLAVIEEGLHSPPMPTRALPHRG
jgi:hypothetical protein